MSMTTPTTDSALLDQRATVAPPPTRLSGRKTLRSGPGVSTATPLAHLTSHSQ
jgi:hypothetical protein